MMKDFELKGNVNGAGKTSGFLGNPRTCLTSVVASTVFALSSPAWGSDKEGAGSDSPQPPRIIIPSLSGGMAPPTLRDPLPQFVYIPDRETERTLENKGRKLYSINFSEGYGNNGNHALQIGVKSDVKCVLTPHPIKGIKGIHANNQLFSPESIAKFQERHRTTYSQEELQDLFSIFSECILFQSDGHDPKHEEQQMILDMIFSSYGLFPKEVLSANLRKIDLRFFQDRAGDADIDLKKIRLDPRNDLTHTHTHEMTHLLFKHTYEYTSKWIVKYSSLVGRYDKKDPLHFLDNKCSDNRHTPYGKTDLLEDMATSGACMFSVKGWQYIRSKSSPVIKKKVEVMLNLLEEVSDGMMNRDFFAMTESGQISNAIEAQRYFARRRAEKKVAQLAKIQ